MQPRLDPLIFDLVDWVSQQSRPYSEVIDAWRTSCPRLTVWEDALDRGFVERQSVAGGVQVQATAVGLAFLQERRNSGVS